MSGPRPNRLAIALATAAAAAWLWINFCRFPGSPWNDLRLAAVFMAAKGEPVYTLPGEGVITTWMYGPVPLWAWAPAALARGVISALLAAGAVNIALTVAAIAATCRWWPVAGLDLSARWIAAAASILLWPDHVLRFLQADNVAVALGLVANLLLIRGGGAGGTLPAWGAALATAAALGCKQTTLGLVAAQVAWLGWEHGRRAWQGHLLRTLGAGLVLGGLAVLQFGARELWFGVVTVPRGLPLAEDIAARFAAQAPFLAIQAGIPLLILAVIGRRLALRGHPLALPALTFLASLPLGLAGISTAGGTTNSFQGLQYILPVLVLLGLARIGATREPDGPQPGTGSARFDSRMTFACAALCCVLLGKILWSEAAPFRPDIAPVRQAMALQQAQPGALWLPWNPLVSYFGEGRFYHAEDGIYVRFITGHPVSRRQAEAGMPAAVRSMAFPSPGMTWDVATKLAPPGATRRRDGEWLIIGWP